MQTPSEIVQLVKRFKENRSSYTNHQYNETQVRREFIDPFFSALGWDVDNKSGYAEAYKEVIHEYSQKTKDSVEAPDYLFRIGGKRMFFVEAKKPSVNLKDDPHPAFQVRRYAWSAKLPLSILTDFEEFIVYDCRIKPNLNDKPSTGRILYYTFEDYIDKWEEISSYFSRDAVVRGFFDKFAESKKNKKGTAEVDDAFLSEIENWRELLAKNLSLRNPDLTSRELNFAVQKTIDRIIFLRICEDRGIEDYGQLMNLLNGANIYPRLLQIFSAADQKYNSGLFYFDEEKNRSDHPDTISHKLNIDDKTLKEIIKKLYYPDSPYEFSVLPADILGHVYEQFLGKVIRLTAGHRAIVEEKPEVKKAGGVYYTPTYIVDYIVKNTLGAKLDEIDNENTSLKNKTESASKLKVLDPACGSGSFLLGAYQYLLDWHLKLYTAEFGKENFIPKKDSPVYKAANDELKLTTAERKRILLNNIYGVDIDSQAVEVTKLSLMLKVLEGETGETLNTQMSMFRQRALPDLGNNIKCGNSLIGPDFYDQMDMNLLDDEIKYRINVFDWQSEFKEIFKSGGFDVVIGNPPYVFGGNYGIEIYEKKYFNDKYQSGTGKINLFTLLLEKSTKLLQINGEVSFIIPNTFLRVTSYSNSRKYFVDNFDVKEIADLGIGVFKGATTSSIILIIRNTRNDKNVIKIKNGLEVVINSLPQYIIKKPSYIIEISNTASELEIISKFMNDSYLLGEICEELIFGVVITKNKDEVVFNEKSDGLKKFLEGRDISRYVINEAGKYLLYEPKKLHRARSKQIFEVKEKLLIQRITGGKRPLNVAYDNQQFYNKESINNLILNKDIEIDIKYILALLNSKLINWFYLKRFTNESKLTVNISKEYLSQIPIKKIDVSNKETFALYKNIVVLSNKLVDTFIELKKANTPQEKQILQRQIETADRQIDKLVYELYGLTEEEIKIVEGE